MWGAAGAHPVAAVSWTVENLGASDAKLAGELSGLLAAPFVEAVTMEQTVERLGSDVLTGLVALLAGFVATAGDGDPDWVPGLDPTGRSDRAVRICRTARWTASVRQTGDVARISRRPWLTGMRSMVSWKGAPAAQIMKTRSAIGLPRATAEVTVTVGWRLVHDDSRSDVPVSRRR
jgi:hypothetical protein